MALTFSPASAELDEITAAEAKWRVLIGQATDWFCQKRAYGAMFSLDRFHATREMA